MAGEKTRNQGEGNRDAAREYDEQQHEFVERGEVQRHENETRNMSEAERRDAQRAEEEGKAHAKEKDPSAERDYSKPTK